MKAIKQRQIIQSENGKIWEMVGLDKAFIKIVKKK